MLSLGFVGFDCVDCDFGCFDDYHRKSDLFLLALGFVLFCFFCCCNFVVFVVDCALSFRTNLFSLLEMGRRYPIGIYLHP